MRKISVLVIIIVGLFLIIYYVVVSYEKMQCCSFDQKVFMTLFS